MRNNFRLAVRRLARRPGLTLAIVITLAIGVGATTAIYSVLRAVILRPFPYPELDQLVSISESNQRLNLADFSVSPGNYLEWRSQATSFQGLAAQRNTRVTLSGADQPQRLAAIEVSTNWFSLLGVPMVVGRPFTAGDSAESNGRVVVLSSRAWRRHFGGDRSVVGRSITLNDAPYLVLGVAAPGVHAPADVWMPLALPSNLATNRAAHVLNIVGRLAPGATLERAQDELTSIASRLAEAYPATNRGWTVQAVSLVDKVAGKSGPALPVLMSAAVFVLLIASVNVANVLLARSMTRAPEFALRLTLGASRADVVRDVMAEIVLLALVGGTFGVALAIAAMRGFQNSWAVISPAAEVALDSSALGIAVAASLLALLVGGLPPALFVTRRTVAARPRHATSGRGVIRSFTQRSLVVAQTALAVLLLTGATLLLKALVQLRSTDLGFDPDKVATASFTLPRAGYQDVPAQRAFAAELLSRVAALPGVDAAAVSDAVPGGSGQGLLYFGIPGRAFDPGAQPASQIRLASPDYFRVLQIALVAGRVFEGGDREGTLSVALVDELLAQRYFAGESPIGKRILAQMAPGDTTPREIVGVVRHARHNGPDGEDQPTIYVPLAQGQIRGGALSALVRAEASVPGVARLLNQQLRELGPSVPIYDEQPLSTRVAQSIGSVRFVTSVAALFGGCAVFLACIGVYGVLAFSVAQRTREIGVRVALGALPSQVVRDVVRNGLALTGAGVVLGIGLAVSTTRALSALLGPVSATDAPSFLAAACVFMVIAGVASFIPAARAGRVDPMIALRAD